MIDYKICQEKSKINVFNKMTKTALDEEISNYVAYHRYYQRLIAVKIVSEGNTIADAANILENLIKQFIDG